MDGFERREQPGRRVIIWAGIAGLAAGDELARAGHDLRAARAIHEAPALESAAA